MKIVEKRRKYYVNKGKNKLNSMRVTRDELLGVENIFHDLPQNSTTFRKKFNTKVVGNKEKFHDKHIIINQNGYSDFSQKDLVM